MKEEYSGQFKFERPLHTLTEVCEKNPCLRWTFYRIDWLKCDDRVIAGLSKVQSEIILGYLQLPKKTTSVCDCDLMSYMWILGSTPLQYMGRPPSFHQPQESECCQITSEPIADCFCLLSPTALTLLATHFKSVLICGFLHSYHENFIKTVTMLEHGSWGIVNLCTWATITHIWIQNKLPPVPWGKN